LLAYDSDGAGVNAALRAINILRESGLRGKVINMEPAKDPDEFIKANGADAFQERIDKAENSFFFEIRILERDYDLGEPDSKTRFYREIAKKLCGFEEEVERENYIEAIAGKYNIGFENLRKMVASYAAQTGFVKPVERPKSTIKQKNTPEENVKKSQRLLLTWITEEPKLYQKIKKYIQVEDFTQELYRKVAEKFFDDLEQGNFNPASIISMFQDEEEQREVASLFNTKLNEVTSDAEREKAFNDIVYGVKKNSFEYYSSRTGSDINAINQVISGKKALEELSKTHISLN
ncbi:MAG: DNA primase, partial [Lachnospiraceae bacterium]|nr:DNA primase [Lachnospiraceae bacterium]